ncbi:hypothetical protein YTPLAS18_11930 [Nitrospira sp.]|nr:hypothetical protein YTPLAS18_11930 [Nitrospira sp.]
MSEEMSRFGKVDDATSPDRFIRFLDEASGLDSVQTAKQKSLALLKLEPGLRVLEVGCGTGDDTRRFAAHVLPHGEVVAIDKSLAMIDEAQQRVKGQHTNIEYKVGDVTSLAFDSNSFDRCHTERTLIHTSDAQRAVEEMVRVLRSHGLLVAFEGDLDTNVLDSSDTELTRKILRFWCDSFPNPHVGRRLPALFKRAGLQDIHIQPHTFIFDFNVTEQVLIAGTLERAVAAAVVTPDEAGRWVSDLKRVRDSGTFFFAGTGFLVSGRKS